jgi:hypothetical protein
VEEASTFAIWWDVMLKELGLIERNCPITILQDNLSTIILSTNGGSFKRTKHLITREMFIRERIANNEIELKHCPAELMHADFLTKQLLLIYKGWNSPICSVGASALILMKT